MQNNAGTSLSRHYATGIVVTPQSGHELRMPIVGHSGMYHSMIYAGICERTGHHLVIDHDKGRTPQIRRIDRADHQLSWGSAPRFPASDVLIRATSEVMSKYSRPSDYNFVLNNCQNFTHRHQHGYSRSPQIHQAAISVARPVVRSLASNLFRALFR
jgi:hypothetical protein